MSLPGTKFKWAKAHEINSSTFITFIQYSQDGALIAALL